MDDDHGATAGAELSSVVTDLDAFGEPEDPGQPLDGRADVVIGEDRQDGVRRNGGIARGHEDIVFHSVPAVNIHRSPQDGQNTLPRKRTCCGEPDGTCEPNGRLYRR